MKYDNFERHVRFTVLDVLSVSPKVSFIFLISNKLSGSQYDKEKSTSFETHFYTKLVFPPL